jgi:16S rRNA (adenine1518-N6/adenine1519-N6)-dimethyltransferase
MFGQHWLTDYELADNIVKAAQLQPGEPVWEIGPGQGVLTQRILQYTADLTAFEIDNRLAGILATEYGNRINLVNRDILALDWQAMLAEKQQQTGHKIKLISNLPYQITSPVLSALEANANVFTLIVLMLQREVADRLTAKAGSKAYGVMTLKLKYHFEIKPLFQVPPTAFEPPPKVHSSVIMLTPRIDKPIVKSLDIYRQVINKAFAQRRKTLRNNLKSLLAELQFGDHTALAKLERISGIDFNRRGETIEEAEYVHLADCVFAMSLDYQSSSQ